MSNAPVNMTNLPADALAVIAAQAAKLAHKDAELMRLKAAQVSERNGFSKTIQNRDTIIVGLRLQLDGHKKHRFGSRSENIHQMELELALEEEEIAKGVEEATPGDAAAKVSTRTPQAQTIPRRP